MDWSDHQEIVLRERARLRAELGGTGCMAMMDIIVTAKLVTRHSDAEAAWPACPSNVYLTTLIYCARL